MATLSARKAGWGRGTPQQQPHQHVQKENSNGQETTPVEKKRKVTAKELGSSTGVKLRTQQRRAFASMLNVRLVESSSSSPAGKALLQGDALAAGGGDAASTLPSDVEALLGMKMVGKTKFDFKGKCEQMMDYIKKLRACIRAFQELDATHTCEKEDLKKQLEDVKQSRAETEEEMRSKQDVLESGLVELKSLCAGLEERLKDAEAQKEALLLAREKDAEALRAGEKDQANLQHSIETLQAELVTSAQQVGLLQDVNKRLQEYNTSLQQYNTKLQSEASSAAEVISRTQKEKVAIMENLSTIRGHSTALSSQLDTAKASLQEKLVQNKLLMDDADRLRVELQRISDDRDQRATQVQALSAENTMYKEWSGKSMAEVELLGKKAVVLEESYSSANEHIAVLRQQLDSAQQSLQFARAQLSQQKVEGAEHQAQYAELQERLVKAEQKVQEGELLRRKLHNTILELKGNIRVFCRVRPLLPNDEEKESMSVVQYPTSTDLQGDGIELLQTTGGPRHFFSFDKVFGPEVKQEHVFVEISQLVQSALDGYKVCMFAYGQTGSGKTHTMLGNPEVPGEGGVIPRSLEQVFQSSQALSAQGWSFRMQASMLEIYNETIRDLLAKAPVNTESSKQYVVKHDQNGNTSVSDLTLVDVTQWKEVSNLLHQASQSRSVGKTAMNEQSSRSHCVFTLRISGVNESTEQQVHGVLNLIDLAGSERLSRSGATGDRLKETQAINKSLSSLGDVIMAIANKEPHVPYRNSKLTYLLQPCLGGESKTLMFVNISPDSKSFNESLCSLRFAAKVNACEIGIPRRQTAQGPRISELYSLPPS
ncbi:unnamed protein product [Sphagnum jensenii]|uniref:Kinesin-like protein n=1 Tax=Sphagnum jensenii TaxID=128206 RepID=A0ABP1BKD9_9BRYO